jgi:hypothetical protein
MKIGNFILIVSELLLVGAIFLWVKPGMALAIAPLPAQPQNLTFQYLSISPSQGTIVSRTQVLPGAGGDLHLAYSAYTANASGKYPAYYAHCAANCATVSNWSLVEVGELLALGNFTRMAVNSSNQPRLMWESWAPGGAVTGFFHYSECNSGCTIKANWSAPVTFAETGSTGEPNYYFNLDHLGRPRFVYADNRNTHTGTFYVYCDSSCTNAGSWHEVPIVTAETFQFSLEFTAANLPRLAFAYFDNTNYSVGYASCDTTCNNGANWSNVLLYYVGSQVNLRLRLDSSGRPRLAFYTAQIGSGNPANDLLFYTWCNATCGNALNWDNANPGLPVHYGETLDLSLDNLNLPHLAVFANTAAPGLVYLSCSAACESASGTWTSAWVETDSNMNARVPVAIEAGCTLSEWRPGSRPSIALIGSTLVFTYDAEHTQSGISCPVHTDYRDSTLTLGSSGVLPPSHFSFVPIVKK